MAISYTRSAARDLKVGDVFADGTWVTEIYNDTEGTWVATSDGEEGYMDPMKRYVIEG